MWVNFVSWAGRLLAAVESCRSGHVLSQSASLTPVRRNVYLGLCSTLTAVNVTGLGGAGGALGDLGGRGVDELSTLAMSGVYLFIKTQFVASF